MRGCINTSARIPVGYAAIKHRNPDPDRFSALKVWPGPDGGSEISVLGKLSQIGVAPDAEGIF